MFRRKILSLSSGEKGILSRLALKKSLSYTGVVIYDLVVNRVTIELQVVGKDRGD
jgi:hypothetical protein